MKIVKISLFCRIQNKQRRGNVGNNCVRQSCAVATVSSAPYNDVYSPYSQNCESYHRVAEVSHHRHLVCGHSYNGIGYLLHCARFLLLRTEYSAGLYSGATRFFSTLRFVQEAAGGCNLPCHAHRLTVCAIDVFFHHRLWQEKLKQRCCVNFLMVFAALPL